MARNCKNYAANGGDKTIIGGTLEFTGNGAVTNFPLATASKSGGVKAATKGSGDTVAAKIGSDGKLYVPAYPRSAAQADSVAADVATIVTDFNALLAKLRTAGLIATE